MLRGFESDMSLQEAEERARAAVEQYGRFVMERMADPHMREKIATVLAGKSVDH